jgi:hypothetical protein
VCVAVTNISWTSRSQTSVFPELEEAVDAPTCPIQTAAVRHFERTLFRNETVIPKKSGLYACCLIYSREEGLTQTSPSVTYRSRDVLLALPVAVALVAEYMARTRTIHQEQHTDNKLQIGHNLRSTERH